MKKMALKKILWYNHNITLQQAPLLKDKFWEIKKAASILKVKTNCSD